MWSAFSFWFYRGLQLRDCMSLRNDFGLWSLKLETVIDYTDCWSTKWTLHCGIDTNLKYWLLECIFGEKELMKLVYTWKCFPWKITMNKRIRVVFILRFCPLSFQSAVDYFYIYRIWCDDLGLQRTFIFYINLLKSSWKWVISMSWN